MEKYVVIGASAAGCNAIKEIRRLKPESEITLISIDTAVYSRCILYHPSEGDPHLRAAELYGA